MAAGPVSMASEGMLPVAAVAGTPGGTTRAAPPFNVARAHDEEYPVERARACARIDLPLQQPRHRHLACPGPCPRRDRDAAGYLCAAGEVPARWRRRTQPDPRGDGLEFAVALFEERFLIADIETTADFRPEREFHPGQSALLHRQPDKIYRIDHPGRGTGSARAWRHGA